MKKVVFLLVAISIAIYAIPAFSASNSFFQKTNDYFAAIGKTPAVPTAKNTFFQKAGESIESIGKPSSVPPVKDTQFQKVSDQMGTWDKGTADAKKLSLRGNPEEVARRRGTK